MFLLSRGGARYTHCGHEAAGAEQGVAIDERVGDSPGAANDDEHHEC